MVFLRSKLGISMKLTFFGHSCFHVEVGGKKLLFDPFISPNQMAADIDVEAIHADYILVSHGHVDHVADVERIARRTNATIISNFEIVSWFQAKGMQKGHPMNLGGSWKFGFGKVKYVQAIHSSVMPDGAYGGNPGGFVVETAEGSFYYSGDTALHMDMQLIGLQHQLNFAIMPIGDNFTMGVEDAIKAAEFCKVKKVIGVHYNTFDVIKIDTEKAIESFAMNNVELVLLNIGQTVEL
jgi:L-ascorbate metabolism protein UlaG (beta-lactamase superfamily)